MADGKLIIATAASQNHARPLMHLLRSIRHHEPDTEVVLYDLGLAPATLARLRREGWQSIAFPFDRFPPHVSRARLRNYAWKPALVRETIGRHGLPLLYLDAGDLLHGRLDRVRAELNRTGFYSPQGAGLIAEWCDPATLEIMQVDGDVRNAPNRNAAIIGFGAHALGREMADAWYACAMRPEIICPAGATPRSGHRFDQSILSILAARAQRRHGITLEDSLLDISYHNDALRSGRARAYMMRPAERGGARRIAREWKELRRRPLRRLTDAIARIARRIMGESTRT